MGKMACNDIEKGLAMTQGKGVDSRHVIARSVVTKQSGWGMNGEIAAASFGWPRNDMWKE